MHDFGRAIGLPHARRPRTGARAASCYRGSPAWRRNRQTCNAVRMASVTVGRSIATVRWHPDPETSTSTIRETLRAR